MSLTQIIKKASKSQYFRRLVVRAIEDGIILILMGAAIWSVCWVLTGILRGLGVA